MVMAMSPERLHSHSNMKQRSWLIDILEVLYTVVYSCVDQIDNLQNLSGQAGWKPLSSISPDDESSLIQCYKKYRA